MRVDLQKLDAEITALRSKLAAINDDLDECRLGYFEHPWAWSQIRRMLTSERHRVQRRLDEIIFARKCVGGRPLGSGAIPSFHSLARLGKRNTEGFEHLDQAPLDVQPDWPMLRVIQGGGSY
jgi:hypothetical protein